MASYYHNETIIWVNSEYVKAADAKTDLYGQSMHYGYSVFEGIRSYKTASGATKIFKPVEHFERLERSARALNMPYHWTAQQLIDATYEVLRRNGQSDAYLRPIVYAPANMRFNLNIESFISIQTWEMQPFLGDKLLRVFTSSFQRPNPKGFIMEAKAGGHYVNSILASQEAKAAGYDEALLTDLDGFVAEGPGANVFMEKDGRLYTPSTGNILPGLTRKTVLELCKELEIPVTEKTITIEELKDADAVFFCGTAAEIVGWKSLDETVFPLNWNHSLSRIIQKAYLARVTERPIDEIKKELVAASQIN